MKRIAIIGYGNIGRYTVDAILASPDFEIAGIVRRDPSDRADIPVGIPVVGSIKELENVDVTILATPTRSVEQYAREILEMGINTVDSFDIHTQIPALRKRLEEAAKAGNAVSVLSAGWDPGSDSVVRALLEAIAPEGITYTNFGPGMSMGHTVAVKSKEGVKNALSMTIPLGTGIHRRMVYVELLPGYELADVAKRIKEDPYFASDETHVMAVESVDAIKDLAFQIKGESNTEEKVFFVAGIKDGEKCALMVMLSEPLVAEGLNAGKLVKEAAKLIQGGGGGQPHFATAGGKNVAGLGEAIEHILDAAGLK